MIARNVLLIKLLAHTIIFSMFSFSNINSFQRKISLEGCYDVTDNGLIDLCHCPALSDLNISYCANVSTGNIMTDLPVCKLFLIFFTF